MNEKMTPQEILNTAKSVRDEELLLDLRSMGREDVRAIAWLIETGKVDTIDVHELEIEIQKNREYRANRL